MRRLAAVALTTFLLVGISGAPAYATALPTVPGIGDCKDEPAPEMPGRGIAGFFDDTPPAATAHPSTYERYGYAGMRWTTYDLGCGPDVTRHPDAVVGTAVSNWIFQMPKVMTAMTTAVTRTAFHPTFLSAFDPLIRNVTGALTTGLYDKWLPVALCALGLLIVWRSRRANLSSTTAAVGWALLVVIVAALLFEYPIEAGHAADKTVTASIGAVSGTLDGNANADPATNAASNVHDAVLYQAWLAGEFGRSNTTTARKWGPQLLDATAYTWDEARQIAADPSVATGIDMVKHAEFKQVAAGVKADDPDAYEYLTGKRSDTRIGYALLATLAAMCALPFLFASALLVIAAFLIVRLAVMMFPGFATLGVFPSTAGLVKGIGSTVAAALINSVVFGIGAAVSIRGIGLLLDGQSSVNPWLGLVLMLLFSVVMWTALRPFRRLTQMVNPGQSNVFAGGAGAIGQHGRSLWGLGKRAAGTALGGYVGGAAAAAAVNEHNDEAAAKAGADRAEAQPAAPPPAAPALAAAAAPAPPTAAPADTPATATAPTPPAAAPTPLPPGATHLPDVLVYDHAPGDLPAAPAPSTGHLPAGQTRTLPAADNAPEVYSPHTDVVDDLPSPPPVSVEPEIVDGQEVYTIYRPTDVDADEEVSADA